MHRHYPEQTELDMNCISGSGIRLIAIIFLMFVTSSVAVSAAESAEPKKDRVYGADYSITPDISKAGAVVELRISQNDGLLRELHMPYDDKTISDVDGDGEISIADGRLRWQPPAGGGRLRWFATINHLRNNDTYDAYLGNDWGLFRAEDVIPPTATRTRPRSVSKTRLMFELPDGWSAVTEYFRRSNVFDVSNPDRRFDRPTGWIVLGDLGVRHDSVAGVRVVVAAPVGQDVRRLDILAMLNWTLPDLVRLLPDFPRRLTVISAGEPMWRGGLSAPGSFYVHAERPLISENGTSTIMHEALHIGLSATAVKGADWITEGLAEYYGLEILRRSGTISEKRFRSARSELDIWGKKAGTLCADPSTGAVTAHAVTLFAELNDEIRKKSARNYDLDDALRRVASSRSKISIQQLREIVADLAGSESKVLSDKAVNNCEN
jgi:hypothetical protein